MPHRYCQNHFLRDVAKPMAGDRQPCQGPDAQEGARPAEDRTGGARSGGASTAPGDAAGDDAEATIVVTAEPPGSPHRRPIRPVPWCSTTARRCAASSTTIRVDRSILPACGWPRPWMRSANRSGATWTRKKGVRGAATRPPGRLHRPRPRRSQAEQETIRGYVEDIEAVAATLDPGRGELRGPPGGVRGVDRSVPAGRGSDP